RLPRAPHRVAARPAHPRGLRAAVPRAASPSAVLAPEGKAELSDKSIHDGAHDLDTHPQGVEFVAKAFADVIVVIAAALVVEADPEFFLILSQPDLERLAGRQTLFQT